MKEVLLCKYGEIILKGANRRTFEDMLCREVRHKVAPHGRFEVTRCQSTVYVDPLDENADVDGALAAARTVFGFVAIARCMECEKNLPAIEAAVKEYLPEKLAGAKTFKVECKRSDKTFPLDSMQLACEVGAMVLETVPGIRVDVHHPDVVVRVEIRETAAYVSGGLIPGAGGMPVGSNGKGLLLLSGGIDSPVAGYMLAKRGVKIEAIHFESFPYTSERAREKVLELASRVAVYSGEMRVNVVSLTHIQEELVRNCDENYFTLLLRRYMMKIAEKIARERRCSALITGESVGQVASQTMAALTVTDDATTLPVFRPCIGMDKEEIITVARKINTFETSIEPYEDCCTVFTPKHPRTRPELEHVLAEERKLPMGELVDEAVASLKVYHMAPMEQ